MKKILLFAGMAALMASCANQETVEVAHNNAIGFNTYVGKATRADLTAATLESFDVYGYFGTDTKVFDGEIVTKSGDAWVTSEPAYWIPNKVYNFAAVAPSSTAATFDAAGLVLTDYTPSGDDLIVAVTDPITGKSSDNDDVQLQFKHALTKVQFNLKKLDGQEVSEVKLGGVNGKGTLTATYNAGVVLSWEPSSEITDYTFTDNSEALYLIPQELTDGVKVTLTADGIAKEYVVKTENVGKWETGHVYTYLIDLTSDLEEIQIVVGDMDDYNDQLPETDDPTEPEPEEPEEPSEDLLTNDVKIDFGSVLESEDNSWNSISTINTSDNELKDSEGQITSLVLATNGFGQTYTNTTFNKEIEVNNYSFPMNVWKDSFAILNDPGQDSDPGSVKITGLNPTQKINILILATRWDASEEARTTKFELISSDNDNISQNINQGFAKGWSTANLPPQWEEFDFTKLSCKFEGKFPKEDGSIELKVIGLNTGTRADAHISAMVISPVVED